MAVIQCCVLMSPQDREIRKTDFSREIFKTADPHSCHITNLSWNKTQINKYPVGKISTMQKYTAKMNLPKHSFIKK